MKEYRRSSFFPSWNFINAITTIKKRNEKYSGIDRKKRMYTHEVIQKWTTTTTTSLHMDSSNIDNSQSREKNEEVEREIEKKWQTFTITQHKTLLLTMNNVWTKFLHANSSFSFSFFVIIIIPGFRNFFSSLSSFLPNTSFHHHHHHHHHYKCLVTFWLKFFFPFWRFWCWCFHVDEFSSLFTFHRIMNDDDDDDDDDDENDDRKLYQKKKKERKTINRFISSVCVAVVWWKEKFYEFFISFSCLVAKRMRNCFGKIVSK